MRSRHPSFKCELADPREQFVNSRRCREIAATWKKIDSCTADIDTSAIAETATKTQTILRQDPWKLFAIQICRIAGNARIPQT
jgi:predicted YcjX-like family ATPase